MTHARRISGEEALALLSDVQLGIDMKLIDVTMNFHEMLVITRPNFLAKLVGKSRWARRNVIVKGHK